MKKTFSKKIYWVLLAAVVPLWLMNFLSGQNDVAEIKRSQPEGLASKPLVQTAAGDDEPMVLQLSLSLGQQGAAEAVQTEHQLTESTVARPGAVAHVETALNMSFILSPVNAAEIGTAQAATGTEQKAKTQQAAERHQEIMLNIENLTRHKVDLPKEDPFVAKLPPPPPPPPPTPPPPPPAPVAPALPFTFMGRMVESDRTTLFLTRQNESYSVKLNDVLLHEYRVDKIDTDQVTFTYLPLNIQQTLYIGRSS